MIKFKHYAKWILWLSAFGVCATLTAISVEDNRLLEWIFNIGGMTALLLIVFPSVPERPKIKDG